MQPHPPHTHLEDVSRRISFSQVAESDEQEEEQDLPSMFRLEERDEDDAEQEEQDEDDAEQDDDDDEGECVI